MFKKFMEAIEVMLASIVLVVGAIVIAIIKIFVIGLAFAIGFCIPWVIAALIFR